jgi:hypothetical protein
LEIIGGWRAWAKRVTAIPVASNWFLPGPTSHNDAGSSQSQQGHPQMSKIENFGSGCLLAIASFISMGGCIVLFGIALAHPETQGSFAIAGAILLGSGIIAVAIGISKGWGAVE